MKKTVIIGATPNISRYANMAADRLTENQYEIVPLGIKKGEVYGKTILPIKEHPCHKRCSHYYSVFRSEASTRILRIPS